MAERPTNVPIDDDSAVFEAAYFTRREKDERIGSSFAQGYFKTRAGIVLMHLSEFTRGGRRFQWLLFEAVIGGRHYTRRETRTSSRLVTEKGATIMAGRWVRALAAELR